MQSSASNSRSRVSLSTRLTFAAGLMIILLSTLAVAAMLHFGSFGTLHLSGAEIPAWAPVVGALGLTSALAITAIGLYARRILRQDLSILHDASQRLAEGHDFRVRAAHSNEFNQLRRSFNNMGEAIRARESDLRSRTLDVKSMLDRVDQGILTLSPEARIGGDFEPGLPFSELLKRADPEVAQWFDLCWQDVRQGFLPLSIALSQLPKQVVYQRRHLALNYYEPEYGMAQVLVVIDDVSEHTLRQRAERQQAELVQVFTKMSTDRESFVVFVSTASELVRSVVSSQTPRTKAMRDLHTLKGSLLAYGLADLAELVHTLESKLEGKNSLSRAERHELGRRWAAFRARFDGFLEVRSGAVEIPVSEVRAVAKHAGAYSEELAHRIALWAFSPVRPHLESLREHAEKVAGDIGKPAPEVTILDNDIRAPAEPLAAFWSSALHLVRNAVDHGLESPEVREACGKTPHGHVELSVRIEDKVLVFKVCDDGAGIDWDNVREHACRMNLPHHTMDDLVAALFADEVSTRSRTTLYSGRGVGLAALQASIHTLGGWIEVHSEQSPQSLKAIQNGVSVHAQARRGKGRTRLLVEIDLERVQQGSIRILRQQGPQRRHGELRKRV